MFPGGTRWSQGGAANMVPDCLEQSQVVVNGPMWCQVVRDCP